MKMIQENTKKDVPFPLQGSTSRAYSSGIPVKERPLVSVLMTVYDGQEYLSMAIESILEQSYKHIELIIVNDGSKDETSNILKEYAKKSKKIKIINLKKNHGPSYASNYGLKYVKGKYIARMDADDISTKDRIEKQVSYLEENPNVVAVGGQCELIDKNGRNIGMKSFPTNNDKIARSLYMYNPVQHPAMMINVSKLGKDKLRYKGESVLAHDLELLFILLQYGELSNLADTILKYRYHSDSLSLKNPKITFRHTIEVRERSRGSYGYIPSTGAKVVNFMQKMIVGVLPSEIVYPLFRLMRMNSIEELGEGLSDTYRYISGKFKLRMATLASILVSLRAR